MYPRKTHVKINQLEKRRWREGGRKKMGGGREGNFWRNIDTALDGITEIDYEVKYTTNCCRDM